MKKFIARSISAQVQEVHRYFPIVYLGGPRQSGKTTLLRQLFSELPYVSLEDPDVMAFASEDPRRFLGDFPSGAILDEAQRVPTLFSYLQRMVDEQPERKFILSGSQNFLLLEKITQSLAGRVGLLTLLPFSVAELEQEGIAPDLNGLLLQGGFPRIYEQEMPLRLFFPNYVKTYLERDVRLIKNVGNLGQFHNFLKLCAGRVGQLLNVSALANEADVSVNTAKAWLSVLEASYLIFRLPPYFQSFNKRITKMRKLYFLDTGLLCHLLGIEDEVQLKTHFAYGAIFENAMLLELYKKRYNANQTPEFYFWRDSNGNEVDLLMMQQGKLRPVEIKIAQTVRGSLFKGLVYWKKIAGETSEAPILLYAGASKMNRKEGLVLPWKEALTEL